MAGSAIFNNPEDVVPFDRKGRPYATPGARWLEFGREDPVLKIGRWRLYYYNIRENDPLYYDEEVKDSVIGPVGVDASRSREMHSRFLPGRLSLEEWRDRRYFLDQNVRAIYEKYPISRQHPGLPFRPTGSEVAPENKNLVGSLLPSIGYIRQWPGILPLGWRFHSAPMGEQCHVKTAVGAKWGVYWGTYYFIWKAHAFYIAHGWKKLLRLWYDINKYSVPIGAGWAAASCLSANLRGKDDVWNMYVGGAAVGAAVGAHKGFFIGFHSGLMATIASLVWYYVIAFEQDILPGNVRAERNVPRWDPAAYKWNSWESKFYDTPARNF